MATARTADFCTTITTTTTTTTTATTIAASTNPAITVNPTDRRFPASNASPPRLTTSSYGTNNSNTALISSRHDGDVRQHQPHSHLHTTSTSSPSIRPGLTSYTTATTATTANTTTTVISPTAYHNHNHHHHNHHLRRHNTNNNHSTTTNSSSSNNRGNSNSGVGVEFDTAATSHDPTVHGNNPNRAADTITTASTSESSTKSTTTTTTPRRRLPPTPQSLLQPQPLDTQHHHYHHHHQQQQQQQKEQRLTPKPRPRSRSAHTTIHPTDQSNTPAPLNSITQLNKNNTTSTPATTQKQTPTPKPRSTKPTGYHYNTSVPISKVRLKLDNSGDLVTSQGKVTCAQDVIHKTVGHQQVSKNSSSPNYSNSSVDDNNSACGGSSANNNSSSSSNTVSKSLCVSTNSSRALRKSASRTCLQTSPRKTENNLKNNKNINNNSNASYGNSPNRNNDRPDTQNNHSKHNKGFVRSSTFTSLSQQHNQTKYHPKVKPSNSSNNLVNPSITDRPFPRKGSSSQLENFNNNNSNNNNKTTTADSDFLNSQSSVGLYDEDFKKASSTASAVFSQLLVGSGRSSNSSSNHRGVLWLNKDKSSDASSETAGTENNNYYDSNSKRSTYLKRNGYRLNSDARSDNSSSRNGVKKIRFYIADDEDDDDEEDNDNNDDGNYHLEDDHKYDSCFDDDETENGYRRENTRYHGNVKDNSLFGAAFSRDQSKHSSSSFESSSRQDEERSRSQLSREEEITTAADWSLRRMSGTELPPIADNLAVFGMGKGRNEKRKTSTNSQTSNGTKSSLNQLPSSVTGKAAHNRKTSSCTNTSTPEHGKRNNNNHSNTNSNNSNNHHNHNSNTSDSNNNNISNTTKSMKKKKTLIPRNHSDSSLKGLLARNNSSLSQASNGDNDGSGTGSGGTNIGGGGAMPPPPTGPSLGRGNPKFLSKGNRALSWCATENSGSQSKLETLFEGQNINKVDNIIINNGSNGNLATNNSSFSNNQILHSQSSNSLLMNGGGGGGGMGGVSGNEDFTMPSIHPLPDRCVSVNGVRSREEVMRLQASNRKLMSEAGDVEVSTLDDFIDRGRMRRSQSDNKLLGNGFYNSTNSLNSGGGYGASGGGMMSGGSGNVFSNSYNSNSIKNNVNNGSSNNILSSDNFNTNNPRSNGHVKNVASSSSNEPRSKGTAGKVKPSHRTMSRNLSVDRIDRLTQKPARKTSTSSRAGGSHSLSRMRRVSSVSALNTPKANRVKVGQAENSMEDGVEDDLCMEASARLVEWLNEVNNVDEYDTDPKDTVIDYVDEPPQTDTALHVVYTG